MIVTAVLMGAGSALLFLVDRPVLGWITAVTAGINVVGAIWGPRGRVVATILFTDIVGSTEQAAALGDREWSRLLTEHSKVVRRELARHGSVLFKDLGDGYLGAFPVTAVSPTRAIAASFGIVDGLGELGLSVRVGIHTGECTLSGNDVHGVAVNLASRIMRAAKPGEVLVSGTVRALLAGSETEFEDRGLRQLKGIARRQHLFVAMPTA